MPKFIIIFLSFISAWGQKLDFEGYVIDSNTQETIPYVNLSFLNTLVGTSTDKNGHFLLEIPGDFLEKQVHISSLGFKDTILKASKINGTKIGLQAEVFELEEVQLVKQRGDYRILNPIRSREISSGFDVSSTPWVVALFFPNIGAAKKQLDKVSIFFRNNPKYKRDKSKFRLRLYEVDPTTKLPGLDLINKNIIVESDRKEMFVTVDLDEYGIKMPRNGVYIGLEWLFIPFNWYPKREDNRLTNTPTFEDRFAPTFGGIYTKKANSRVVIYGMGQWQEFIVKSREENSQLVPAISLRIRE